MTGLSHKDSANFYWTCINVVYSGILINACLINCEWARGFVLPFLLYFMVFMIAFPTYMEDFVVFLIKKIDLKLFSRPSGLDETSFFYRVVRALLNT